MSTLFRGTLLRVPVINVAGEFVFHANAGEVERMITNGQGKIHKNKRCLILEPITGRRDGGPEAGRTHTSRGGMLAAIGRSQSYVISERRRVTGFKTIYPEDRGLFHAAVLDAMTPAAA